MYDKLEKLLRYHRRNVWHPNEFLADCHERALKRIKKTRIFKEMCDERQALAERLASERLLRLWQ